MGYGCAAGAGNTGRWGPRVSVGLSELRGVGVVAGAGGPRFGVRVLPEPGWLGPRIDVELSPELDPRIDVELSPEPAASGPALEYIPKTSTS